MSSPLRHTSLKHLLSHLPHISIVAFVALTGLSGCASISPAPFTSLSTSVQQLREGADASLSMVQDRTRDRYIIEAASGDLSKSINALLLTQPDNELFGWISSDPPLFLRASRFRDGIYRLNSVLVEYAGLLGQMASPDLIDPKTFEQLARDLNRNVKTAAQAFTFSHPTDKEIAMFSALSTAAFRAYLQNKQRSSLLKALEANQSAIQDTADLGAMAVRMAAQMLRHEYDNTSQKLAKALAVQPPPSKTQMEAVFRELVVLDEKYIKELLIMSALHQSYVALPSAHRDLALGLENPKLTLPMVQEISENGRQLYRLYEELRKNGSK
ncbi:hypothetical protein [Nitrosospira sp. Is2]|uniref:hypothetical protein n=1 Tax=Nitrosospira sp. Is2 TaxID=3080532 RepID=UPI00295472F6|nr:hypothetical protein [Nitrosospira sp. Is2]WON74453.1 hypothetical protein R5L00_02885 [Nitrosospira sp. Is2]